MLPIESRERTRAKHAPSVLKRPKSKPRQIQQHATAGTTQVADLPESLRRLIHEGVEALRDPSMERLVRQHLEGRGDSTRDMIKLAMVAGRFQREQAGSVSVSSRSENGRSVFQSP